MSERREWWKVNGTAPSAGAPYKQGWSKFTRSDRRGRDNLPLGFITGVNASLPGGLKVTALAYNENTDWHDLEFDDGSDGLQPRLHIPSLGRSLTNEREGLHSRDVQIDSAAAVRSIRKVNTLDAKHWRGAPAEGAVGFVRCPKPVARERLIPFTCIPRCELPIRIWGCQTTVGCDTGATVSLISTATLTDFHKDWPGEVRAEHGEYLAVDERPLDVIGRIAVPCELADRRLNISVTVIRNEQRWFILGTRELDRMSAVVVVGEGLMLDKAQQDVQGIQLCRGVKSNDDDIPGQLHVQICPLAQTRVPGLSQARVRCRIMGVPNIPAVLERYQDCQFLIRPCLCVVKTGGRECKSCELASPGTPWQLATLRGKGFDLLYQNPRVEDMIVTEQDSLAASFTSDFYTAKELAQDIMEEMEVTPLDHEYSEQEVESFNMDMNEFNKRLSRVITEPPTWDQRTGFEPPLLFELGGKDSEPAEQGVALADYLKSFPCEACKQELGASFFCSPTLVEECRLRAATPVPIANTAEVQSRLFKADFSFDYESNCLYRTGEDEARKVIVICHRKNMQNLAKVLEPLERECAPDNTFQTAGGVQVAIKIARFYDQKTIYLSTEFLRHLARELGGVGTCSVHLSNFSQWGISEQRLTRIFCDKGFALVLYKEEERLGIIDVPKTARMGRKRMVLQPELKDIPKGLPSTFQMDKPDKAPEDPVIMAVSEEVKKECLEMLRHPRFDPLWSKSEMDVGNYLDDKGNTVFMSFRLTNFKPVLSANRFVHGNKAAAAADLVQTLLKHKVARTAVSRVVSQSVYVRKARKKITLKKWRNLGYDPSLWVPGLEDPHDKAPYRLTVDFSQLCPLYEPIPIATVDPKTILANMGRFNCISLLDISQSFFALSLDERSCQTLGFFSGIQNSPYLQFTRATMGHPNSSALLSIALTETLKDHLGYVTLYADDVVIYSDDARQGMERLALVLMQLTKRGFKIKRHKLICLVEKCPVKIYGMHLDMLTKTLYPEKGKLLAVLNRPTPTDKSGLKSLLGALNWQASFLRGCAQALAVLHGLTRMATQFRWGEDTLIALETCLDALASPSAFTYLPHPSLGFLIVCDASTHAMGAYLVQVAPNGETRVVSYATKAFDSVVCRASPAEREMNGMVCSLLTFWSYIEGRRTLLLSDSRNAVFLSALSRVNSKMQRVASFLASLEWLHVYWASGKSKALLVADFLSRSTTPKAWKNKKPTEEDLARIDHVADLLPRDYVIQMRDSAYIIDCVTSKGADAPEKGEGAVGADETITKDALELLETIGHGQAFNIGDIGVFLANQSPVARTTAPWVKHLSPTQRFHLENTPLLPAAMSAVSGGPLEPLAPRVAQCEEPGQELTVSACAVSGRPTVPLAPSGAQCEDPGGKGHARPDCELAVTTTVASGGPVEPLAPGGALKEGNGTKGQPSREYVGRVSANPGQESNQGLGGDIDESRDFDPHNTSAVQGEPEPKGTMDDLLEYQYGADLNEAETMEVYFGPLLSDSSVKKSVAHPPKDRVGKFLHVVTHQVSPHLSIEELARQQRLDPMLEDKIIACEREDSLRYREGGITWILGKQGDHRVLCREVRHDDKDAQERPSRPYTLQLAIPRHAAYTLLLYTHRSARENVRRLTGSGVHAGIKKTCLLLSNRYYIPHLSRIATDIINSCDMCADTRLYPIGRVNFIRRHAKITRPAAVWSVDEFQPSQVPNEWGFNKLLTFACVTSRFVVFAPVMQQMTNEYFCQLLMVHIIQTFGKPMALIPDEASQLSGALVRETCAYLSIGFATTAPYQPQASVAEAVHRIFVSSIKQARQSFNVPTKSWNYLLAPVVNHLNYTPYRDGTGVVDCPAYRMFGPQVGANISPLLSEFPYDVTEHFKVPGDVARLHQVSFATLQQRRLKAYRERVAVQADRADILPGDIVALKSLSADKTSRRNKYRFVVHATSNSCVYIRPWEQGSIERWLDFIEYSTREKKKCPLLPVSKVDKTRVQKLNKTVLQFFNSNQDRKRGYWAETDGLDRPPDDLELDYFMPVAENPSMFEEESVMDKYSDYEALEEASGDIERLQQLGHDVFGLDENTAELVLKAEGRPARKWYKRVQRVPGRSPEAKPGHEGPIQSGGLARRATRADGVRLNAVTEEWAYDSGKPVEEMDRRAITSRVLNQEERRGRLERASISQRDVVQSLLELDAMLLPSAILEPPLGGSTRKFMRLDE